MFQGLPAFLVTDVERGTDREAFVADHHRRGPDPQIDGLAVVPPDDAAFADVALAALARHDRLHGAAQTAELGRAAAAFRFETVHTTQSLARPHAQDVAVPVRRRQEFGKPLVCEDDLAMLVEHHEDTGHHVGQHAQQSLACEQSALTGNLFR